MLTSRGGLAQPDLQDLHQAQWRPDQQAYPGKRQYGTENNQRERPSFCDFGRLVSHHKAVC
jgi:hypothetical protein